MWILLGGGYIEGNVYYFYLNDHLGNNRVVTNASGTVTQKNHYYPFGTTFAESTSADAQPYKYNGKELDKMHGLNLYDYSARYYESAIGRFTTIDPLAEKYYSISPYVYVANNPLKFIDPTGMEADTARIYTEKKDFGHTWISVGEGKDMIVYTYGRYGEVNDESHGRRMLSNGEGVLLKLRGKAASEYNKVKSKEADVSVFQITDVSDEGIKAFFDAKFNSTEERPQEGTYKNSKDARVIDEYKLLSNNCTTIVADALNDTGSNALIITPFKGLQMMTKRPIMPRVMQNILTSKSYLPFSRVKREGK